jgi:hypothetical protein
MFYNCSLLNYIKALFTTTPSNTYTSNWVKDVAFNGVFVMSDDAKWNPETYRNVNGIPEKWDVYVGEINDANDYCIIEALEDGLNVGFTNQIEYSTNSRNWSVLNNSEVTPTINKGDKIYFKSVVSNQSKGIGTFNVNKQFTLKGNIMSLLLTIMCLMCL